MSGCYCGSSVFSICQEKKGRSEPRIPNAISPCNTFCCKDDAELDFRIQKSCHFLSTLDFISFWVYFQYKSATEPVSIVAAEKSFSQPL